MCHKQIQEWNGSLFKKTKRDEGDEKIETCSKIDWLIIMKNFNLAEEILPGKEREIMLVNYWLIDCDQMT